MALNILDEDPIFCRALFDRLGRTPATMAKIIRGETNCPQLEAVKIGGRWMTTTQAVERWIAACDDRESTAHYPQPTNAPSSPDRTRRRRSEGALAPKGGAK